MVYICMSNRQLSVLSHSITVRGAKVSVKVGAMNVKTRAKLWFSSLLASVDTHMNIPREGMCMRVPCKAKLLAHVSVLYNE